MIEVFDQNLDFLKGQEIVKVLYTNTDFDYLQNIDRDLKDITFDMDVSYSSNRYIEFNHKGVNKGAGLKNWPICYILTFRIRLRLGITITIYL